MPPGRAVTMLSVVFVGSCLVTNPVDFQQEAPVSRPFLRDIVQMTSPRLGSITVLQSTDPTFLDFTVPVDSQITDQALSYQWFFNEPRDCVSLDGGTSCEPTIPQLQAVATGSIERVITRRFGNLTLPGCYKIELWVSTAGFLPAGDFHTPVRAGDVDFTTWWVIREPAPPAAPIDITTCQINPTQPSS